jgi:serine/threonine-protein kinase
MAAPKPEQRVGAVLDGKYELQRFLGSGASGAVYAAYHRYTEREVAVKILHAHLLESRDHVARFLREARVAASISHPNVASVIDAGRTDAEGPYLVTDLLEGEELWDRMRRSDDIPLAETFGIVEPLLRGLHAAHEKGVIHRDVKPENVYLAKVSGQVVPKLIDFGIAKRPWSATSTVLTAADRTVGTPLYMAPEQIRGSFVDARTDLWAVGILLHELIAGHPPFTDRDPLSLLTKIVKQRAPSVSERVGGLPAWVIRVVDRALEPKPDDRWPTAAAMADAIVAGRG